MALLPGRATNRKVVPGGRLRGVLTCPWLVLGFSVTNLALVVVAATVVVLVTVG